MSNDSEMIKELVREVAIIKTLLTEREAAKETKKAVTADKEWLNRLETQEYLGISKPGLYGLVNRKTIPNTKVNGRLMFNKTDLDVWLSNGKRLTIDEIGNDAVSKAATTMNGGRKNGKV